MNSDAYNSQGKKVTKKVKLDKSVFASPINKTVMKMAVDVFRTNQRQGTAHTKTRSEVRGGGAKPWAQKGTGRARHGSIRSPIWKGGGVTFGPRNERNYKRKLPRKVKKLAIRSAFSQHAKDRSILILEDVKFNYKDKKLTKNVVSLVAKLPTDGKKVLFIHKGDRKDLYLGGRNIQNVSVIPVNEVNIYALLNHDFVVILEDTLEKISKNWGKEDKTSKVKEPKVTRRKVEKKEPRKVSGSIETLGLPLRTMNALSKAGIKTQKQLTKKIEDGGKIKGVGPKGVEEIKKLLKIK